MIKKICLVCQHEFKAQKEARVYCSKECSGYRMRGKRNLGAGHSWLRYGQKLNESRKDAIKDNETSNT